MKGFNFEDLGYSLELHEGPFCDKRNVTANSYELWMEDIIGGGDNDRDDVKVFITQVGPGKYNLSLQKGSAGYHFDLIDTLSGRIIKVNFGDDGQQVQINNAEGGKLSYGMVGHDDKTQPTQHINRNYGHAGRIYAIDFPVMQLLVPLRPDVPIPQKWSDPYFRNPDGTYKFARHKGLVNALMGDGHTESFYPKAINPETMWSTSAVDKPTIEHRARANPTMLYKLGE